MKIRLAIHTAAVTMILLSPAVAQTPADAVPAPQSSADQTAPPKPAAMGDRMTMHSQKMADMKAAEAKLDALVTALNAASGSARLDALAAVVNELVRQKKAMSDCMARMPETTTKDAEQNGVAEPTDPHRH